MVVGGAVWMGVKSRVIVLGIHAVVVGKVKGHFALADGVDTGGNGGRIEDVCEVPAAEVG